ncbi:MAG TPA: MFS transporter [Fimbriimonas sp.]
MCLNRDMPREGTGKTSAGWRISVYLFLVTATFGFLQPFVPLYMASMGLDRTEIGLVTGVSAGTALLFQPLLGRLSDLWDRRLPFVFGSALLAGFAYLGYPFARTTIDILILTALGSNGITYLQVAGGVLVGRMVRESHGGATYASYRVWGSVGYILVSLLSGYFVRIPREGEIARSMLDPLFRVGPLLFFLVALLALFLPDRRNAEGEAPATKGPIPANLKRFLVAYFLYTIALYGASPYLSLYLKSLGATGPWITGVFAGGVVIEVLVMTRSGALSDTWGRRPALAIAFLLLPLRLLLYIPATGPAWIAAVQSLHGLNFGIVGAVAVAFANDMAPANAKGMGQARLAAAAGLAMAAGPMMMGVVSQHTSLRAMWGFAAAVAALAAMVLLFGVEDSHSSSQSIAQRYRWLHWLDAPPRKRD